MRLIKVHLRISQVVSSLWDILNFLFFYLQPKNRMGPRCEPTVWVPALGHRRWSARASSAHWGVSSNRGSGGKRRKAKSSRPHPNVRINYDGGLVMVYVVRSQDFIRCHIVRAVLLLYAVFVAA